jgi:hypothetical protein
MSGASLNIALKHLPAKFWWSVVDIIEYAKASFFFLELSNKPLLVLLEVSPSNTLMSAISSFKHTKIK